MKQSKGLKSSKGEMNEKSVKEMSATILLETGQTHECCALSNFSPLPERQAHNSV